MHLGMEIIFRRSENIRVGAIDIDLSQSKLILRFLPGISIF